MDMKILPAFCMSLEHKNNTYVITVIGDSDFVNIDDSMEYLVNHKIYVRQVDSANCDLMLAFEISGCASLEEVCEEINKNIIHCIDELNKIGAWDDDYEYE